MNYKKQKIFFLFFLNFFVLKLVELKLPIKVFICFHVNRIIDDKSSCITCQNQRKLKNLRHVEQINKIIR